jgi:double zinc ribbon protein
MAEIPSTQAERHCSACGALLYEGAAWCGMCFTPVEPDPPPVPGPGAEQPRRPDPGPPDDDRAAAAAQAPPSLPFWPCPVCESKNPLDMDICATCGASFASLMRQEVSRNVVDPRVAFRRSLLFPGLGHRLVAGREVDGFARGILFGMLLIATLMLGFSGVRSGAVFYLFLLYLGASVFVYVTTAFEASRLAAGGQPLIPSRTLLWATVAILFLSIVVVTLVIGTATRR